MAATAADTILTVDDVHAARETIAGRLHRTPTFSSRQLSELTGGNVFLKGGGFQRTRSVKPPGGPNKLAPPSPRGKAEGGGSLPPPHPPPGPPYPPPPRGPGAPVLPW